MNLVTYVLLLAAVLMAGFCLAVLKAITRRLAERVAIWVLPDGQRVSYRLAWALVRIARRLAPRCIRRWRGMTSSGPDYQVTPFEWTAPDEALADLGQGLKLQEAVPEPVRLVLPLLAEAVRLRAVNARHVLTRWLMISPFLVVMVLVGVPFEVFDSTTDRVGRLVGRISGDRANRARQASRAAK